MKLKLRYLENLSLRHMEDRGPGCFDFDLFTTYLLKKGDFVAAIVVSITSIYRSICSLIKQRMMLNSGFMA